MIATVATIVHRADVEKIYEHPDERHISKALAFEQSVRAGSEHDCQ